jgi:hypothetical protein
VFVEVFNPTKSKESCISNIQREEMEEEVRRTMSHSKLVRGKKLTVKLIFH